MKTSISSDYYYLLVIVLSLLVIAGSIWYAQRPVALPPPPTLAEIQQSRQSGLLWLENNFADGLFRYELDMEANSTPNSSNALRQLMASRVAAIEAESSETWQRIHTENVAYVLDNWYTEDERGGYVLYKDKSKLGANAMLLRTLVYSPDFNEHANEAQMMVRGIIALQQKDGSFEPWIVEPNYPYDANYLLHFYSGEAILALVEYYQKTGDKEVLQAAETAADFYINRYSDDIEVNYHPAYVPWHTMAYYHLYKLTGDERYPEAIFTMNDRLLELLDMTIYPGRFYQQELKDEGQSAPHSSSDAVYLEGLLYAYEIAGESGEFATAERYRQAIELSAARLLTLQHNDEIPYFKAPVTSYLGAIPVRENSPMIRVDTTQHTLDALEKYLKVFEEGK